MSTALADPPAKVRTPKPEVAEARPAFLEPPTEAPVAPLVQAEPMPFKWTPDAYHLAAEAGMFGDSNVELIRGDIYMTPPPGPRHTRATNRLLYGLLDLFRRADGYIIEMAPPQTTRDSEPQPDVLVRRGDVDDLTSDPERVVLVVEASRSTLRYDRGLKLSLYAEHGYREYWILNLVERVLEVHRDPRAVGDGTHTYGTKTTHGPDDLVVTLEKPDATVKVGDLLPPADLE